MSQVRLTRGLLCLMAAGAGFGAANAFYNQPLLLRMRDDFRLEDATVGFIPFFFQAGYAAAMILLVPLADLLDARRLIIFTSALSVPFLAAAASAPNIYCLLASALGVGATAALPQLFIPLAARLAPPERRGRAIGVVASGLLVGLLLARAFAGFVGAWAGWRGVYWIATGLMATLTVAFAALIPSVPPSDSGAYRELLGSLKSLFWRESRVRKTAYAGGLLFMGFYCYWGALDFLLESPAYGMGSEAAGAFGLLGAAGAIGASLSGRMSDRFSPRTVALSGVALAALGFAVMASASGSLAAMVAGVLLLDFGAQAAHVSNQSRLYGAFPQARSRIASVYVFFTMTGSSLGSFVGAQAWVRGGWGAVCAAALGLLGAAFAVLWLLRDDASSSKAAVSGAAPERP